MQKLRLRSSGQHGIPDPRKLNFRAGAWYQNLPRQLSDFQWLPLRNLFWHYHWWLNHVKTPCLPVKPQPTPFLSRRSTHADEVHVANGGDSFLAHVFPRKVNVKLWDLRGWNFPKVYHWHMRYPKFRTIIWVTIWIGIITQMFRPTCRNGALWNSGWLS